ncbi:MAG TPA: aldehyde ferredoxin oxidoreductase C-terminal domain-containing protein [Thermoleophilia bacterium]|nr:aldehyde ferredoxin oxidoreductase C-terminal domain-containing protein [Thermoleophilia bacterium]
MADLLHIDLTNGTAVRQALPADLEMLGGHGLSSAIVAQEVDPTTDPLGPDNVLVYAAGILAGTSFPNSGRLSVGAKSPLTGGIKEANSGGSAARKMAAIDMRAIKVTGRADALSLVEVGADGGKLVPAPELEMLGTYETVRLLRERYGDGVCVICAGPAGEMQLKAASVTVTSPDFRPRAAARGGLGAVMGSKNLKAIVIDDAGGHSVKVADQEAFKAAGKRFSRGIRSHPAVGALEALGTPFLVDVANTLGCLTTRNFSAGEFEGAESINGARLVELMKERPNSNAKHRCMAGCVISCSQVFTDEEGNEITSGFEFETLGLLGSNCGISDLDQITRIDRLCDDLGLDTIEIGAAVGVAMEGGLLPWGDGVAIHELLSRTTADDGNARMIANGCVATGIALGVARIPAVKGQGIAAWEPRVLKGTGTTYATSPQGGDHTAGNALPSPANPGYDPSSPDGQAQVSQFLQAYMAAVDSLGMCLFACLPPLDMPELQDDMVSAVAALTGKELPKDYLVDLGTRVVKQERDFNRRAGFTAADDRLPAFMVNEPLPPTGNVFDVSEADLDGVFAD